MLIRIDHATIYSYQHPPRFIIQALRLTPRSTEGQHIRRWDIETDVDARLRRREDAFGNITHALYIDAPTERLTIRVTGEVETTDLAGVVRAGAERLSPLVYLRDTPLTARDEDIVALAAAQGTGPSLDRLHGLMQTLHSDMTFEIGATTTTHTAAQVLKLRRGVCQDYAHLFIAAARCMGVPARYVSGHLFRDDGQSSEEAAHAWAEAYVENLGWIGFDPANGLCPTDAYVRVAVGLDYLGAAPVKGSSYGGGAEHLAVRLDVRDARAPAAQQQGQQQA